MSINFKSIYKILFVIGLLLGFASVFLDWYYLQGISEVSGETVVYWVYNALFDWSTLFSEGALFNEVYQPKNATMPIAIVIVFIIILFLSAYSVLFHDVERGDNLLKVRRFNFINLSLVTLIGFFVLIFPLFFLLPNGLYYPFLLYYDYELQVTFYFSIGPGYFIQFISFGFTFPYALFNHSVITTFEKEQSRAENTLNRYLKSVREELDLDKLIAREEYELESTNNSQSEVPKSEVEKIYEDFLTTRGRK
ncbi:MAG: hypothetical protein HWN80_04670 [Candidatus Lokiarchaeota archaeon]|nr:hypothetical protein [Candidatus Lokiarchaeota archaeon]